MSCLKYIELKLGDIGLSQNIAKLMEYIFPEETTFQKIQVMISAIENDISYNFGGQ